MFQNLLEHAEEASSVAARQFEDIGSEKIFDGKESNAPVRLRGIGLGDGFGAFQRLPRHDKHGMFAGTGVAGAAVT